MTGVSLLAVLETCLPTLQNRSAPHIATLPCVTASLPCIAPCHFCFCPSILLHLFILQPVMLCIPELLLPPADSSVLWCVCWSPSGWVPGAASMTGQTNTCTVVQVLDSPTHGTGCTLPDDIPGQVNFSPPQNFSFFSDRQAAPSADSFHPASQVTWTNDSAATSGLQLPQQTAQPASGGSSPSHSSHSSQSTVQLPAVPSCLTPQQGGAGDGGPARWGLDMRGTEHKSKASQAAGRAGKGPVNEVVCGAMMLAYERAGKWEQVSAQYWLCCSTLVDYNDICFWGTAVEVVMLLHLCHPCTYTSHIHVLMT